VKAWRTNIPRPYRDEDLTAPGVDTESYYVRRADWARLGPFARRVLLFNQTLLGRLTIGPLLRLRTLVTREVHRVRQGDRSHLPHWGVHAVAVGALFWFISGVCAFPWWRYVLLVAFPGMSLGLLRAFYEHRAAPAAGERTASVESNAVFGMLFLYNNLHVVHHRKPALPWYDIPRYYREHRQELLQGNGHFVFAGYGELARKYLLVPVFDPLHPTL
jgi:fatty acid desaturase